MLIGGIVMDVRNCSRCGKVFGYIGGPPLCPSCKQKDEEDYKKVKQYLQENPGATMKEVSEACEVSIEKITRYLREGRLEIREGSNIVLECEVCGKSIKTGRFCEVCSRQLGREISSVAKNMEAKKILEEKTKQEGIFKYLKNE